MLTTRGHNEVAVTNSPVAGECRIVDAGFYALARSQAPWRDTPAVKGGRIHLAPTPPYGWIDFPPSLNRWIGLRWLARILYPRVFPDDLRPIVRNFYTRCNHQTPSDAQLDKLPGPR